MVVKLAFVGIFGTMVCMAAMTKVPELAVSDLSQSPFAVYAGDSSWDEEVVFLYQLKRYLRMHPNTVGHIVYYSDEKISRKRLERRLVRSVRYLTGTDGVSRKRLKVYYGGEKEQSNVYLQPFDKGSEPPTNRKRRAT